MRVASDAILERAADVRRSGKSWMELTRNDRSREATLEFFRGVRPTEAPKRSSK